MKEQDYQKKISDKLKKEGWYVIKLIKTSVNGIPDLIAIKSDKTIFIECKTLKGKLSKIQEFRLDELKALGIDCFVSYGNEIKKI